MNNVLELMQNVDLSQAGQRLQALLDTGDPVFPAIVLGILTLLGAKMTGPYPALRSWGLRAAVAVFLISFACAWWSHGSIETAELPRIALHAAVAAGCVLAPLWLVFPVVLFVYVRLRLALAAFLIYAGYECISAGKLDLENLPQLALHGGLAAGLALLVAWIVQPISDFLLKNLFPQRKPAAVAYPLVAPPRWQEASARGEAEQTWRLHEMAAELLHLKKAQLCQPTEQHATMHRRRQRARLKAELCYTLNEPALGTVLPRAAFEDFLTRYLGDQHDPETVEENAQELEAMILQHVEGTQAVTVEPAGLEDLTQWFLGEQQRLRHDEADQGRRRTKLAGLTRRYTQLAEKMIEEEVR
jgi:hypothetical protein